MRERFADEGLLFDLAALEARMPDGGRCVVSYRGRQVPAMNPAFTKDGGHLNGAGRAFVADQFVAFLRGLQVL
jgi:hypothetical protein